MGGEGAVKMYDAACGSKGTTKAAFEKLRDAGKARMDALTGCTKEALCDMFDSDDSDSSSDDSSSSSSSTTAPTPCCLNLYGELIGMGLIMDLCGSKLNTMMDALTAEQKTAADAGWKTDYDEKAKGWTDAKCDT